MASKPEACPKCRAVGRDKRGDNLQRWPDGHAHCFACEYHEWDTVGTKGTISNIMEIEALKKTGQLPEKKLALPFDASYEIDHSALQWLSKYDIEMDEVKKYGFMWSKAQSMLVFPFYAGDYETTYPQGTLMGWQGRRFAADKDKNRYLKVGGNADFYNVLNLTNGKGHDVVIVEDWISAIKVARGFTSMALLGSTLSTARLNGLKNYAEDLTFWLDEDKAEKAQELAKTATMLGFEARYIITKHDPKAYTNEQIEETLSTHFASDAKSTSRTAQNDAGASSPPLSGGR